MIIDVPQRTLQAWGFEQEAEFLLEIGILLFQQQRVSLGKAAQVAGLNRWQFMDELKQRNIPAFTYTEEMLEQDLKTLRLNCIVVSEISHQSTASNQYPDFSAWKLI